MNAPAAQTPYAALIAFQRDTEALSQVAGRLGWDQETVMPAAAAPQRAEECGALEAVLHARRADPRIGDWLAAIETRALDPVQAAQVRHIARSYARTCRVPADLAVALARLTSRAQGLWAEARAARDAAAFVPVLAEIVALKRQEAAALSPDGDPYDALLDEYEPGTTGAQIAAMFERMRPRLVALCDKVRASGQLPDPLDGTFAPDAQLALAREIAARFGYDFGRGRIDQAVHPFSSGSGQDVRITTRVDPLDPLNCLYSTIHEVGHACYEQAIDPAYLLTPLGAGVSMGVHESQSRIYENQFARSRAFTGYLFGAFNTAFGRAGAADAEQFYRAINRVVPGYIRTESDELHYNLHIMMRFDLERDLIAGALDVADLEAAWNARFLADFGLSVDRADWGVLQDVHWSVGLFGYFPTYALGNVYAGCLYQALRRDIGDLDSQLQRGDPGPATAWLAARLQRHGGLFEPVDLIERACGQAPDEGPLLTYLEQKFSDIYGF